MSLQPDTHRYHQLQDALTKLYSQPDRDMAAIDGVIAQLDAERRRLKASDGQPGNNPIESSKRK